MFSRVRVRVSLVVPQGYLCPSLTTVSISSVWCRGRNVTITFQSPAGSADTLSAWFCFINFGIGILLLAVPAYCFRQLYLLLMALFSNYSIPHSGCLPKSLCLSGWDHPRRRGTARFRPPPPVSSAISCSTSISNNHLASSCSQGGLKFSIHLPVVVINICYML